MRRVALTIAGSDPSGGAGIQADLRTFAALGVAGLSVVTALTVQNSRGVESVHPVPAEVVTAQMETILRDTRPDAVKIGMLGGLDQVRAVAAVLGRHAFPNIVLDPVLASTGGVPLLDEAGRTALTRELAPLCALVIPNLDEDRQLNFAVGPAILVKGGHRTGEPEDILTLPDGREERFSGTRIPTTHTHGTGCFLSSAIAASLAQGMELPQAIRQAKRLLTTALQMPVIVGTGRGYPDATAAAARQSIEDNPGHRARADRLTGLYVLTDPKMRPERSAEEIIQAAVAGGAQVVQLRDKGLSFVQAVRLSVHLGEIAHAADALFIVNDRVDVALAANADGVHLGPDDVTPDEARRILGPEKLVGVSVSSVEEARAAASAASYFGVGAIYGTATKGDAGPPIGVGRITEIKAAFPSHPIVAIGGIGADNIGEVARAGADAAAVVSAVVCAPEMTAATQKLLHLFHAR